jgi:hypothetical protein
VIALLVLMGCGGLIGSGPDADGPEATEGTDPSELTDVSVLTVDSPSEAVYQTATSLTVSGKMRHLSALSMDGAALPSDGTDFSTTATLSPGLNVVDIQATGTDERVHRELRSVLHGQFASPDGFVDRAVQVQLSGDELSALAPMLSGLLDPADLSTQVTAMNPVIDDGDIVANVLGVEFEEPIIELVPTDGALQLAVTLPQFTVPLEAETQVLFIPITVDGALTASSVTILADLGLGVDGQGGLALELLDSELEMLDFAIEIDGLAGLFAGGMVDEQEAQILLAGELEGLLADLPEMANTLLEEVDLSLETELMGQALTLDTAFSDAGVTADGIHLGIDLAVDVQGASASGAGHLLQGAAPRATGPVEGLNVQIADDFMNRFLHELWAAGAIDIALPIEPTGLESALLLMFGGEQGTAGSLSIRSDLPPTWIEGPTGDNRLQLGAITMTVETPGGAYGDTVELAMALDARAEIALTETEEGPGIGILLSDADITLAPRGEGPELDELRAKISEIESGMGIGIGMLNDLLAFPIDGLDLEALPEFDLERDPAGAGQTLALSLDGLDLEGLLSGEDTTDPADPADPVDPADTGDTGDTGLPAPPDPEPMHVVLPADAAVHSSDETVDADGWTGWVCRNDDVDATGADGTWYVDDNAGLVVTGSGNTIYAYDDADVVLEAPGNTVYADVGANVEDVDGTNLVVWVEPMTFDDTAVPDGC